MRQRDKHYTIPTLSVKGVPVRIVCLIRESGPAEPAYKEISTEACRDMVVAALERRKCVKRRSDRLEDGSQLTVDRGGVESIDSRGQDTLPGTA